MADVSRSFAWSLRLLPAAMRGPTSLAYLLARASDTLADMPGADARHRLGWLDGFAAEVAGAAGAAEVGGWRGELAAVLAGHPHPGERVLLERLDACLGWLGSLPAAEAAAVRRVVATIISGQRLDLLRFGAGDAARPVALTAAELDDYTFRVAGCVGEFWTGLAATVLGGRFARLDTAEMARLGIDYGKGLQLVNILRDLPADLAQGRCYLPAADPRDRAGLLATHGAWRARARQGIASGLRYAAAVRGRRLRAASVLPALLAAETLDLLDGIGWEALARRPKVARRRVYQLLWRALWWRGGRVTSGE